MIFGLFKRAVAPVMPGYVWRGPRATESLVSGLMAEDAYDPYDDIERARLSRPLGVNFYETGFGTNRWHLRQTPTMIAYEFSDYARMPDEKRVGGFTVDEVVGIMKRARHPTGCLARELTSASRKALAAHKKLRI